MRKLARITMTGVSCPACKGFVKVENLTDSSSVSVVEPKTTPAVRSYTVGGPGYYDPHAR